MSNPLLSDRNVEFLLFEVLDAASLCKLPAFAEHSAETFELYIASARKLARDVLYPAYKPLDEAPPVLEHGRVKVHPVLRELLPRLIELGVVGATRPAEVGGQQLPMLVAAMANAYLMAANLSAYGYVGLTTGAARLIESFGNEALKREYMDPMYAGRWTGTMALTEPQAGSSLTDVQTRATPTAAGHYLIRGSKIFISGGDQDISENIVHLALGRIDGAPPGIKGVSLFAVPKLRRAGDDDAKSYPSGYPAACHPSGWTEACPAGDKLVSNDVSVAGLIHKIGWRGLPSLALNYGENDDCHGWLVGEPHQGIRYMFQMMNEARLMVGLNGVATASVAYHESLEYATTRPQGRRVTAKDPTAPQVPIIAHADVRRMLLRQKAIVEGGLALLAETARYVDLAEHSTDPAEREHAQLLLDLLTPIAKSFPAERGFESNALAVQIHGGYGYSSEYLPESWLRDQKLNSIHEGTTGIQSLDLLGRKVMGNGGRSLFAYREELMRTIADAHAAGVTHDWCSRMEGALAALGAVTEHLAALGMRGEIESMLLHSADYLDLFATVTVAWQWLKQAAAASRGLAAGRAGADFYEGKLCAAQYWIHTELPRVGYLAALCRSGEDSYARVRAEWL